MKSPHTGAPLDLQHRRIVVYLKESLSTLLPCSCLRHILPSTTRCCMLPLHLLLDQREPKKSHTTESSNRPRTAHISLSPEPVSHPRRRRIELLPFPLHSSHGKSARSRYSNAHLPHHHSASTIHSTSPVTYTHTLSLALYARHVPP